MLDLFLVRHAESEMNTSNHLICGRSHEIKISPRGQKQAALLGQKLKEQDALYDYLYVSSAIRAQETLSLMLEEMTVTQKPIISDALVEMSLGDWEGKERAKYYTPEVLAAIKENPLDYRVPNGESKRDVSKRMLNWIKTHLFPKSDTQDIRVLAVTHGWAIKSLLLGVLDPNLTHVHETFIDNTSVTHLAYVDGTWQLVSLNDKSHLPPDEYTAHLTQPAK